MNQRGDEKRAVSLHIALSKEREKEHFVFVALEILPWCGDYHTVEFGLCGSTTDFVCWSIVIVLFLSCWIAETNTVHRAFVLVSGVGYR